MGEHTYPESYGRGLRWSLDAAWEILDAIKPGVIPDTARFWLAGAVAGRLERVKLETLTQERRRVHEARRELNIDEIGDA